MLCIVANSPLPLLLQRTIDAKSSSSCRMSAESEIGLVGLAVMGQVRKLVQHARARSSVTGLFFVDSVHAM